MYTAACFVCPRVYFMKNIINIAGGLCFLPISRYCRSITFFFCSPWKPDLQKNACICFGDGALKKKRGVVHSL